jgi:hypothetical protein
MAGGVSGKMKELHTGHTLVETTTKNNVISIKLR